MIEKLERHKQKFFYGALILLAAFFFIGKRLNKGRVASTKDYLVAEQLLDDPINLGEIVDRHHELQAKYGGRLAQLHLNEGNFELARSYAEALLKRTEDDANAYAQFTRTTLLIAEEKYQEALNQALALHEKIPEESHLLAAHNLLRIAILQDKLGEHSTASWSELLTFLEDGQLQETFLPAFSQGELTLTDYANKQTCS